MLEIYNPTVYLQGEKSAFSLFDLRGKRVAFLSNNKPNVDLLFDYLAEPLSKQLGPKSLHRSFKANVSRPSPEGILQELTKEADLVINGVGD